MKANDLTQKEQEQGSSICFYFAVALLHSPKTNDIKLHYFKQKRHVRFLFALR